MKRALIIIDPNVRVNQEIILGICDELGSDKAWDIQILRWGIPFKRTKAFIKETKPDAIAVRHLTKELADYLEILAIPFVVVADEGPAAQNTSVVTQESHLIGKMAAEYLSNLNFQYLAVVDHKLPVNRRRSQTFVEIAKKNKKKVAQYQVEVPKSPDHPFGGYHTNPQFVRWLRDLPKPCAVFAHSDQLGVHIIRTCLHNGIRVPEEVSVVGVDDDHLYCLATSPNLTSVHVPYRRIGIQASRMLIDWKPGRRLERIAPTSIVERSSCRPPLRSDPLVDLALKHLREGVSSGIKVSDLQKLTGLSPNQLVYRFHIATGYSPMEMILNQRINTAKRLLVDTREGVGKVGHMCGFNSATQFYVTFKERVGFTPSDYRKQFTK